MIIILIGFIASLIGLFVARYISKKVKSKKPLMCPRNAPCEDVVTSVYGTTFGVANTRWGQLYYFLVALMFVMLMDGVSFPLQLVIMMALVSVGFLFSLYLVIVQAFVLKKWCLWCVISAVCATIVFFSTMYFAYGVIHR